MGCGELSLSHMQKGGTNNSYIPQTEQHEPEQRMLFCLGNVTNLLDVTPSNQMSHPFHFVLFKVIWLLSNIQQVELQYTRCAGNFTL